MTSAAPPLSCPVCGSAACARLYAAELSSAEQVSFSYTFSPEHSRTFQVLRCSSCTHVFCAPLPSDMASRYQDVVDDEYLKHSASRRMSALSLLAQLRRHHPPGRLLDVGCATGDFLAAARDDGQQGEGIELSDWSSRIARARGLRVHQEYLEAFAATHPGEFDFVTLWGVIEHFANPRAEIRHIADLLKPGGILALWTGDVDSVTSRLLKRKWWYWQGQHIQYFSRRSLTKLVEDAGLEPVTAKLYPFGASLETISNSLRRYPAHDLIMSFLKPVFRIKPTWSLKIPGEMFFIARKPAQSA